MTNGIQIDRLILDIPTLSPPQTEELAHAIAAALASASPAPGAHPTLTLELDDPGADIPVLANRIAHSLLQQIG